VDYAVHVTSFGGNSLQYGSDMPCGMEIAGSFYMGQLDTSCLSKLIPPDFAGTTPAMQAVSSEILGVPNMWGS
jgi:hypothetical protein